MSAAQQVQELSRGPSLGTACLGFVSSTMGLVALMVLLGSM